MQGQVTIGPEYFRKERDNYSRWSFAFWRELFQNSVDAGASNISIDISSLNLDGTPRTFNGQTQQGTLVQFKDNGCGMTTDTLKNVYFCLGETTKNDTSTIGGYGKARILTCFSHFSYGIKTLDNRVFGNGSTYDLKNGRSDYPGCLVYIDVDERGKFSKENIVQALFNYLELSQMKCSVNINVDGLKSTFSKSLYRRREARKLPFGRVYVNKSSDFKNSLIVRVDGVPMFIRSTAANALVILEIDKDKSRDVLLSNRDSLTGSYELILDEFLQELAINTRSALRQTKPRTTILGNANSACVTVNDEVIKTSMEEEAKGECMSSSAFSPLTGYIMNRSDMPSSFIPGNANVNRSSCSDIFNDMYDDKHPAWVLHVDNDTPTIRKSAWLWDPSKNKNYGNTKRKTAILWSIVVQRAIKVWLKIQNKPSISWLPGFVFSDEAEGMHSRCNDIHRVMICPIDKDGKHRYSLTRYNDRLRMAMVAAHEVAHFTYQYHDEEFDTLCFEITHKLMCEFKSISKEMSKDIKMSKLSV